jgi:hypothetical protein
MKIIIELDNKTDQPTEIRRVIDTSADQQFQLSQASGTPSSGIDAGQPRINNGIGQDSTVAPISSSHSISPQGATGAIDAGAAKIQEQIIPAFAMPDTGSMETVNQGNAFSAGALAGSN